MNLQDTRSIPQAPLTAAQEPLTWEADIPLFKSAVVLRQLTLALGLPVLVIFILLVILSAIDEQLTVDRLRSLVIISLGLLAGLLLLAAVAILLVYGSRYHYRFTLDEHGAQAVVAGGTRSRNRIINLLLVLSGQPSAMGAGLLAEGRQEQQARWGELDTFSADPHSGEILLRKGRRVVMLLWCDPSLYPHALARLEQRLRASR